MTHWRDGLDYEEQQCRWITKMEKLQCDTNVQVQSIKGEQFSSGAEIVSL